MNRAGWFAALILLWVFTWVHSTHAWLELEQYRYGWAIPPLALFLVHRRWRGDLSVCKNSLPSLLVCVFGLAIFARGVCLTWLDPSWRMTGALLTLGAVCVTAGWLHLEGGWQLLRRQLFPLAFCFLALPWPKFIEHPVTLALLKVITAAVVVFLNLCGVAAAQQGNVIELHLNALGMETACSGIESLQAALMAAVFLGELNGLPTARRWRLAGFAVLLAMTANFLRISGLAFLMEFSGPGIESRFHDMVGGIATVSLFLVLVFAAGFGTRKAIPARTSEFSRETCAPGWTGWGAFTVAFSVIIAAAITFGLSLPTQGRATLLWKIDPARLPPGWTMHADALTAAEQKRLRHGREERWHLRNPDGAEAYVIYLRWNDGVQTDATAYPHSPGLCLPSQGWTQEGVSNEIRIPLGAGGEIVPFSGYRFSRQTDRLVALQCLSSGSVYLPPPSAGEKAFGGNIFAAFYRRPQYVSEDMLIYLPEAARSDANTAMVRVMARAFRAGG